MLYLKPDFITNGFTALKTNQPCKNVFYGLYTNTVS